MSTDRPPYTAEGLAAMIAGRPEGHRVVLRCLDNTGFLIARAEAHKVDGPTLEITDLQDGDFITGIRPERVLWATVEKAPPKVRKF